MRANPLFDSINTHITCAATIATSPACARKPEMPRPPLVPLLFALAGLIAGYLWLRHGAVIAYEMNLSGGWGNICF